MKANIPLEDILRVLFAPNQPIMDDISESVGDPNIITINEEDAQ